MVKPAEDGLSSEPAETLNRPMGWHFLPQERGPSGFIVIASIRRKDPAQVGFAEDDDVIEAFPASRKVFQVCDDPRPLTTPNNRLQLSVNACVSKSADESRVGSPSRNATC